MHVFVLTLMLFLTCLIGCGHQNSIGPAIIDNDANRSPVDRPGQWNKIRKPRIDPELDAEIQNAIDPLQNIGYVAGSREPETDELITIHLKDKVYSGLNFYNSAHAPEAMLMDMDGKVLHRWRFELTAAWPDQRDIEIPSDSKDYWRRAYLYENGDLLAIFEGAGLLKVDKNSRLIWATRNGAHHDLDVMDNGDIFVLTRQRNVIPRIHSQKPVVEDFVVVLDKDGHEKNRISVLECFENSYSNVAQVMPQIMQREDGDNFHTNTIEVLDGKAEHFSPVFKAGNILLAMRHLNLLAIVDPVKKKFVWDLQTPQRPPDRNDGTPGLFFRLQHDPQILDGGQMLLFDNCGLHDQSTIWEFHPISLEIFWHYRGTQQRPFYTSHCGTVQRLPNGNTLITESEFGRVFEMTPQKEIVWEYYNPERAGDSGQFIAMLPEMIRLPADFPVHWAHDKE